MNADGSGTIDQITDSNYIQKGPCFYVPAEVRIAFFTDRNGNVDRLKADDGVVG